MWCWSTTSFETERFEAEIASGNPSIVHVASHAVFTGDPTTSFVLTHDGHIDMERLSEVVAPTQFRKRKLELLALSACATAAGDERAGLGLAGVAIRAGARSAIGSLWTVSDEATSELFVAFYEELRKTRRVEGGVAPTGTAHAHRGPALRPPLLLVGVPVDQQLALRAEDSREARGGRRRAPAGRVSGRGIGSWLVRPGPNAARSIRASASTELMASITF